MTETEILLMLIAGNNGTLFDAEMTTVKRDKMRRMHTYDSSIKQTHTAIAYVNAKMQTLPVESCGRDASKEELEASSISKRATVPRPDAGRSEVGRQLTQLQRKRDSRATTTCCSSIRREDVPMPGECGERTQRKQVVSTAGLQWTRQSCHGES